MVCVCVCLHLSASKVRGQPIRWSQQCGHWRWIRSNWAVKEVTSLCLHMGTGHPPAPFGPEVEISLVALIKHRILTTDLQTLRVLLLLATPGSWGERCKGHKPKSLVIVGLAFMKKKTPYQFMFAAVLTVKQKISFYSPPQKSPCGLRWLLWNHHIFCLSVWSSKLSDSHVSLGTEPRVNKQQTCLSH